MKVCFVGCGSIGKRHIKNLQAICLNMEINLEIHLLRSGKKSTMNSISYEEEGLNISKDLYSIEELDKKYDIIFITNPTFLHYDTLKALINRSDSFFVEKPVFDNAELDYSFIDSSKIVYVACPLRYTGCIRNIREYIELSDVFSVRAICSSYLPDWRPGIDYRKCYSAHKDEGGGVRIDLVHEWDYLTSFFGFPNKVNSFSAKLSKLEIDSEDLAVYIAEYDNMAIELHLDYFGRVPRREVELYTKDYVYKVDIINNFISCNTDVIYEQKEDTNLKYIKEMEYFLELINGSVENSNDVDNAIKVMKLAYS